MVKSTYNFALATTEQAGNLLQKKILFLVVGSTEQHGPHLPLSVDCDIPQSICEELGIRLEGLVGPAIPYGARSLPQSGGGAGFPGTIHVRGSTLIQYLYDVIRSYVASGARRIVVVNGHYENEGLIFEAVDLLREERVLDSVSLVALSWWSVLDTSFVATVFGNSFVGWHAEHASLVETSLMLFLKPSSTHDIRVDHPTPPEAGILYHPVDPQSISCRGVLHRTSEASAEHGRILFQRITDELAARITKHMGVSPQPEGKD
jgi:creatinine amidohydrolase